ncbi:toxin 3FTx-Lei1-like [Anolis carolinensis]|uniref:toxin 3FTx-Lei1-like n=1 Tax=Anolis carolinensis TaxID=28377 RepID=UPI002F2B3B2C
MFVSSHEPLILTLNPFASLFPMVRRRKLTMNKVVAVSFLTLLSFDTVRMLTCLACKKVVEDNSCLHNERSCKSGGFDFCYSRVIAKGTNIENVDRGCTKVCRILKKSKINFEEHMICCVRDYCNIHNFWTDKLFSKKQMD